MNTRAESAPGFRSTACCSFSYVLGLASVIAFLVLSALQAAKPLNLDSMDFPAVAEATATSGVPTYYRGEETPAHSGLYHPPLYIYSLAAWFKVVGASAAAARMFGALCLLALGGATLATYGCLLGRRVVAPVAGWFWLVFLLNPFSLQTAAIPDIDSTIYGPVLVAILWLSFTFVREDGAPRGSAVRTGEYMTLIGVVALAFWCKLTTVLVFPAFIALIFAMRFRFWIAVSRACGVACAGFLVFLASYQAYGWALGQNTSYTFAFVWDSFRNRGSSATGGLDRFILAKLDNLLFMIPFAEKWTTALPWLVGALVAGFAVFRAYSCRGERHASTKAFSQAILPGVGLFVVLYYSAQVKSFGNSPFKYWLPVWGLMMFPVSWVLSGRPIWELVDGAISHPSETTAVPTAAVLLCSALAGVVIIGDNHLFDGRFAGSGWVLAATSLMIVTAIVATFPRGARTPVRVASLLLLVHSGLQMGICVVQVKSSYSTTYNYRQQGLQETAAFIAAITEPDEVISSMKDIGYAAHRRYLENYGYVYGDAASIERFSLILRDKKVRYLVFSSGIGEDQLIPGTPITGWVAANCRQIREIGNYRIFQVVRAGD